MPVVSEQHVHHPDSLQRIIEGHEHQKINLEGSIQRARKTIEVGAAVFLVAGVEVAVRKMGIDISWKTVGMTTGIGAFTSGIGEFWRRADSGRAMPALQEKIATAREQLNSQSVSEVAIFESNIPMSAV